MCMVFKLDQVFDHYFSSMILWHAYIIWIRHGSMDSYFGSQRSQPSSVERTRDKHKLSLVRDPPQPQFGSVRGDTNRFS